jgi:CDP-diacylglycerol--glycerol-3-phosphate 3-phosphatidyltransferase
LGTEPDTPSSGIPMSRLWTWANRVTVTRIALVFFLVVLVYHQNVVARLLAAVLAVGVIVMDWLDGYLARRLKESTTLGGVLDIAGDRIIENVLWIILADLRLVPVWIPIVVVSRDILTDGIRGYVLRFGYTAFGERTMMRTPLGRFLTGSPLMRTAYAVLKAFTFGWLLGVTALAEVSSLRPRLDPAWIAAGLDVGYWSAVLTAAVCLVRGIPVIIEGVALIQAWEAAPAQGDRVSGR